HQAAYALGLDCSQASPCATVPSRMSSRSFRTTSRSDRPAAGPSSLAGEGGARRAHGVSRIRRDDRTRPGGTGEARASTPVTPALRMRGEWRVRGSGLRSPRAIRAQPVARCVDLLLATGTTGGGAGSTATDCQEVEAFGFRRAPISTLLRAGTLVAM